MTTESNHDRLTHAGRVARGFLDWVVGAYALAVIWLAGSEAASVLGDQLYLERGQQRLAASVVMEAIEDAAEDSLEAFAVPLGCLLAIGIVFAALQILGDQRGGRLRAGVDSLASSTAPLRFAVARIHAALPTRALACVLLATPLLGFALSVFVWRTAPAPDSPNVLLIVLDTARKENFSLYGHSRATTPHIDRFAQHAMVFENAFAISAWTVPNHASMFTGQYPTQHGATHESKHLPAQATTLAEMLADAGYATAGFVNNANIAAKRGFAQGFERWVDLWRSKKRKPFEKNIEIPEGDQGAVATRQALLDWYDERRDPSRPWFAFLNYIEAHSPYRPAGQLARAFGVDETLVSEYVEKYDYVDYLAGKYEMTDEAFQAAASLHDAELNYLDEQVGLLMAALETRGALDDTLVLITSDHGESFGQHGLPGHQFSLYDTLLRVPLIARFPGTDGPVGRSEENVELVDLFATVLAAANVDVETEALRSVQSRRIDSSEGKSELFAEYFRPIQYLDRFAERYPDFDATAFDRRLRSLRIGDHKLIWSSDGRHELYDVKHDPAELVDLASSDPQRVAALAARLDAWFEARTAEVGERKLTPEPEISEEMREQLRALGYAE